MLENLRDWLILVYGVGNRGAQPVEAERLLRENPVFADYAPYAAGNLAGIEKNPQATAGMPPLVALTHSSLARLRPADFAACLRALLAKGGVDVNATRINPAFPDSPLSVLYGAAGFNHQPELTQILLEAGANPNDGESLYHSTEARDLACTRLLLAAGANPKGSNALNHSLDRDDLACTQLLLDAGADPNEGMPALLWAIRRRRSLAHFDALLAAGADASREIHQGLTPYRAAMLHGMPEAAARIRGYAPGEPELTGVERFIAACTAGDRAAAQAMLAERNWMAELPAVALRLLPDLVEAGHLPGAMLMTELGWPVASVGGDWRTTALNLAVFRGDPVLTEFFLRHGSSWEERHGYNDDVRGTLSFASTERPVAGGDWVACARALVAAGMPRPAASYTYSREVQQYSDTLPVA